MNSKFNTCSGPSMHPTLKSGDGLILETFEKPSQLKVGDVIVYSRPDKLFDIVHRIIKIEKDGVITRGDNNNKIDPGIVPFSAIIGIVLSAKRKNMTFKIHRGNRGLVIHKLMLLRKYTYPYLAFAPKTIINTVSRIGILKVFHKFIETKIVYVNRNGETEKLLYYKNKAIGRFQKDSNIWKINYLYKPFIDKKKIK